MILTIVDENKRLSLEGVALLRKLADAAAETEGVTVPVSACLTVVDDAAIQAVNRAQRGKDAATDVLSFPSVTYHAGQTAGTSAALLRTAYDDETRACFLGDILISIDHARAQASEYGHSEARETGYLLVHGLFHLMGYDHMEPEEKKAMRAMEEQALSRLNLTRRTDAMSDEALIRAAYDVRENAYAPYSGYRVGAALLAEDGRVFTGCNVENAAYGNTYCAERSALVKAISEGCRRFTRIAIVGEGSAPWPCGACRQSLFEFAPELEVVVAWDGHVERASLHELLPHGFGPQSLGKGEGA